MHDSTVGQAAPARVGRREWLGLIVLALPTLLMAMDQSILYLALPRLSEGLHADSTQSLWILDIYGFMLAGFLVTMGTLGDRIGRRKLLMMGAAGFLVSTILAAYSVNPTMLIVMRAVMGVSGATLMPSTLALITNMFTDAKQRASAIAAWFSALMVGGALGPIVGGILLDHFWWGSVFLIGVPVMALLLIAGPILLPEYRAPRAGRVDLVSVVLSLLTILPVIYGIKELAADNGSTGVSVGAIVVGVVFGVAFVLRQRRLDDPLVDLKLFRSNQFRVALLVLMASSVTIGGMYLFVSLYLQAVKGQSPLVTGLWLVPSTLAIVVSSSLTPALAQKVRPAFLITGGMLITALGYFILTFVSSSSGLALLVIGFVIAFFGGGPMGALGPNMVISTAPPERAGAAASMSETSNQLGIALGIAVMGSIGNAVYRGHITHLLPGVGTVAKASITGAVNTAAGLPAEAGQRLLTAARDAFSAGLNIVAVVGAVGFVLLAALVALALRKVQPAGEGGAPAEAGEAVPAAEQVGLAPAEVVSGSQD
jgi:DHA2 family multidrug resistance protein-like MFS transporter